ncbi:MAG: MSHA biogenesis protein MshK [Betaproteobacteria bacterium]|nr:MSHA biogenesis protein MshK [Betaproteobacteria bacterium]
MNRFRMVKFLILLLFAVASDALRAQHLSDPMRPPVAALPAPADGAAQSRAARAGVQSILISRDRRIAIIDGEQVEVGGRVRGAEVTEINANEVVLRGRRGTRVLRLSNTADIGSGITRRVAETIRAARLESNEEAK